MHRALVFALLLVVPTAIFAAPPEAITINSSLQARVPPVAAPPGATTAFASVLLLTGSNGALGLTPGGDIQQQQQSFVIRSAYRFLGIG
jgi:hypothetical protein